MRPIRLFPTLATLLVFGIWAVTSSQPIAHAQQNLLTNPSLDGQYNSFTPATAPRPFINRVKGGAQAVQHFTFFSTHTAGMWQQATLPDDNYVPFEIEAAVQGTSVTLFRGPASAEPHKHNDIYWDEASLLVEGQDSTPLGGSGAVLPAPVSQVNPTPTPNAEGLILVTVQPGDTMWALAARAGLTLDQFLALNPTLTSNSFINVGEQYVIGKVDAPTPTPTPEPSPEPNATTTENSGDSAGETAAEATPTPTAEPSPTAAPVGATVCLHAFDDLNRDGVLNEGEGTKAAVAFTIADGEAVISNYVTDGVSEPYCIEGLPAGTYRISRSLGTNEIASNAPDWALSLTDGANFSLDFGSYMDETAAPEMAEEGIGTTTSSETATAATENATSATSEGADNISSTSFVTWIIVGIAALLLIGVILVVLSGRRA